MATAILRSHDCLRDQLSNPNPRINHAAARCRRRKRSPAAGTRRSNKEILSILAPKTGLVMGQVKILKRGEDLNPKMFSGEVDLCSTDRLGPDPATVQKQIRVPDLYAAVSPPPPSSLPFPAAFLTRTVMETDLMKLLRI